MEISYSEYYKEINSIAASLLEEAKENYPEDPMEWINDEGLHQEIDNHSWIIYNAYHLSILQHSSNAEAAIDEGLLDAEYSLKKGGLSGLHQALAFWAMYRDVQEVLQDAEDSK